MLSRPMICNKSPSKLNFFLFQDEHTIPIEELYHRLTSNPDTVCIISLNIYNSKMGRTLKRCDYLDKLCELWSLRPSADPS